MKFKKITIIGLGLIGGSLAGALKNSKQVDHVTGIDIDDESLEYAIENGIIDSGFKDIDDNISDSDIVVIASYVESIPEIASKLKNLLSNRTVVTDVGSVKSSVVEKVEKIINRNYEFVGGHPISGTENSGVKFSNPDLFRDKKCILTPTEKNRNSAIEKVEELWKLCGSRIFTMSPEVHDRVFSFVSHLPHVVAYSLINTLSDGESDIDLFDYAGGGLRDFTRIAGSSPGMWSSIFMENKKELLESISEFKAQIEKLEKAIQTDNRNSLLELLEKSRSIKSKF